MPIARSGQSHVPLWEAHSLRVADKVAVQEPAPTVVCSLFMSPDPVMNNEAASSRDLFHMAGRNEERNVKSRCGREIRTVKFGSIKASAA